jgi:hypothetical protein
LKYKYFTVSVQTLIYSLKIIKDLVFSFKIKYFFSKKNEENPWNISFHIHKRCSHRSKGPAHLFNIKHTLTKQLKKNKKHYQTMENLLYILLLSNRKQNILLIKINIFISSIYGGEGKKKTQIARRKFNFPKSYILWEHISTLHQIRGLFLNLVFVYLHVCVSEGSEFNEVYGNTLIRRKTKFSFFYFLQHHYFYSFQHNKEKRKSNFHYFSFFWL